MFTRAVLWWSYLLGYRPSLRWTQLFHCVPVTNIKGVCVCGGNRFHKQWSEKKLHLPNTQRVSVLFWKGVRNFVWGKDDAMGILDWNLCKVGLSLAGRMPRAYSECWLVEVTSLPRTTIDSLKFFTFALRTRRKGKKQCSWVSGCCLWPQPTVLILILNLSIFQGLTFDLCSFESGHWNKIKQWYLAISKTGLRSELDFLHQHH